MSVETLSSTDIMIITAITGVITNACTTPISIVETRMICDRDLNPKPILQHFFDIFKEGGITAFWKGFGPGLILVVNPIINFVVYERMKSIMIIEHGSSPSANMIFLSSLVGKFSATVATYPILTLKTKAFTDNTTKSTMKVMIDYVKKEGVYALYRGIYAKLCQTLMYNAFMMIFFEKIKFFIETTLF